jgi:endothelin-converting enzyme
MNTSVSKREAVTSASVYCFCLDNGWLKANPLPADKSSFGNFEALALQNKQVIQRLLERSDDSLASLDPYDQQTLRKLRDMYSSCLNEETLDKTGNAPLVEIVRTIRNLYREKDTLVGDIKQKRKSRGLTAALAFIHSKGRNMMYFYCVRSLNPQSCRNRFSVFVRN